MTRARSRPAARADFPADPFVVLVAVFLLVALAAGGSSTDPVTAGLVRACGVPVLALALWRLVRRPAAAGAVWPLLILAAAALIVVLQLIPLPPALWRSLPGRGIVWQTYAAGAIVPPWLPISLTPGATFAAGLGLIPPAAMFIAVLTLGQRARTVLIATAIAMAVVSVGVGMLQVAGGQESPLRPYLITDTKAAVGFFANRNHEAAFLAASLPLAACLAARRVTLGAGSVLFWSASAAAFALVIVVGALVTGSRAGAVLVILGFLGAVAIAIRPRGQRGAGGWRFAPIIAVGASVLVAGALVSVSANSAIAERVRESFGGDLRLELIPRVAKAGLTFAPVGSGVGSFPDVYQMFETPQTLAAAYVNHAHDEFVEVWLECGLPGVALVAAFLAWGFCAARAAFSREDADYGLAGAAIVAMLLVHSMVDYPLRTPALATLFALACGLMLPPLRGTGWPGGDRASDRDESRKARAD